MGGNSLSKSWQVGIGKQLDDGSIPSGSPWYFPISDFFLKIICTINYWNYFQGCGPFNWQGCEYLVENIDINGNKNMSIPPAGWLKFSWVIIDLVALFVISSIATGLGFILSELSFIPQVVYDAFSLVEGIISPLLSLLESGATYIMQFLGFGGSIAGQSLFGLASDVTSSFSQASGIPPFVFYVLLAELGVEVFIKIYTDYIRRNTNQPCAFTSIYKFLDTPFWWLTTKVFPQGMIHDFLSLLFLPPQILIFLFTEVVAGIFCYADPKSVYCTSVCP